MEYLEGWSEFNVALMGAAAALAGLLIVAASVNISQIVEAPAVAARLLAALVGLMLAIVGSAVGLIPGITTTAYGATILVFAVGACVPAVVATRRIYGNVNPANRLKAVKAVVGFIAPLAYAVGGALLVAGVADGVVWFAVGAIAAIVAALIISWIALVEVLR